MNLHQLQNQWDDEAARARTAALRDQLRHQIRAEAIALPLLLPVLAWLVILIAAALP